MSHPSSDYEAFYNSVGTVVSRDMTKTQISYPEL